MYPPSKQHGWRRWPTGDEARPAFWDQFIISPGERLVARDTAIFVCKLLLERAVGYGAGERMQLDFEGDVSVSELFATLEELTGGTAGWQWLLKQAEVK